MKYTSINMDTVDGFNNDQGAPQTLEFQSFDEDPGEGFGGQPDEEPMLHEEEDDWNPETEYPMYRLNFYRKYFNVETTEVMGRLRRAAFPWKVDFLDSIHSKPDLYGPFWGVTTLVLLIGVCGSMSDRFMHRKPTSGEFEKISAAASFLYTYHSLCPFLLWLYTRTRMQGVDVSLVEFACLYGYANTIFIPVAILSIIENYWLRIGACTVGLVFSLLLLYQSLMPLFRNNMLHLPILGAAAIGQCALALSLVFYFFAYDGNALPSGA